tara:strand:- start:19595 stop:19942 length:348 start_codon:yes stop_codon:yes gene_type:complete
MGNSNDKSIKLNKLSIQSSKLTTADIGTISEHEVICQLIRQGYSVAKSVSPQCLFDLVAVSPLGEVRLIDVKTSSYRKLKRNVNKSKFKKGLYRINRAPTAKQKKLNIEIYYNEK